MEPTNEIYKLFYIYSTSSLKELDQLNSENDISWATEDMDSDSDSNATENGDTVKCSETDVDIIDLDSRITDNSRLHFGTSEVTNANDSEQVEPTSDESDCDSVDLSPNLFQKVGQRKSVYGRRRKQLPKHRSKIYLSSCSNVKNATLNEGAILKGPGQKVYHFEKNSISNIGSTQLVIDACKNICISHHDLKFRNSALAALSVAADEYLKAWLYDILCTQCTSFNLTLKRAGCPCMHVDI